MALPADVDDELSRLLHHIEQVRVWPDSRIEKGSVPFDGKE
jgi:hypothetical protein